MKKKIMMLSAVAAVALLSGCASHQPMGVWFTDISLPVTATSNAKATKVGKSYCKSYLGLITQGDASIEAAKKAGGITEVVSVDWKAKNILGVIGEYECIVTGN